MLYIENMQMPALSRAEMPASRETCRVQIILYKRIRI